MSRLFVILIVLALTTTGGLAAQSDTITLVTHDSFAVSDDVLAAFEDETGITVEILFLGDAGTLVNQSVLSRNNPFGDVLFGVDNTFLSRALENDLFEAYESPLLENVAEEFMIDERVTPVDFGDVCLNYDIAYFEENDIPVPQSLADLTDPIYEGLIVVQNPATSSPGLAFLLTTISTFGEEGDYTYLDFWSDLADNGLRIVEDWTSAYYGDFTLAGGDYPLVVSYASSPPVEVVFADPPTDTAPTAAITADGTCFRQIEYAGILNGTDNREAAEQLIDFMLSETFQEDIPLQMFVFPVNENAQLPDVFVEHATIADNPATIDPFAIEENRTDWIEAWTDAVRD